VQVKTVEIADALTRPALVIIEAPMGEGKTEAALYLADRGNAVLGMRGHYVALPTQATSNQKQWSTGDQERGPDRPAIPVKCERAEAKGVDVITAP
jgi:hypothetical protein